jgi:hypothetical protein
MWFVILSVWLDLLPGWIYFQHWVRCMVTTIYIILYDNGVWISWKRTPDSYLSLTLWPLPFHTLHPPFSIPPTFYICVCILRYKYTYIHWNECIYLIFKVYGDYDLHNLVRQRCMDFMEADSGFFSQFVVGGMEAFPFYLQVSLSVCICIYVHMYMSVHSVWYRYYSNFMNISVCYL